MPLARSLPPSLFRHVSLLSKTLLPRSPPHCCHARRLSSLSSGLRPVSFAHKFEQTLGGPPPRPRPRQRPRPRPMADPPTSSLSTAAAALIPTNPNPGPTSTTKSKKKARRESPEGVLRHHLDQCSKRGDLPEALRLYDAARAEAVSLSLHHFNVLLYLCSSAASAAGQDSSAREMGLQRGFEIFRQMDADGIAPNEATFTSVARLAAAGEDPELAFDLLKQMGAAGIPPKLRSFGPALFGFCKKGDVEKAHEVEAHMAASGVNPEEPELTALLGVNAGKGRGDDVYRLLHRIRGLVRQVSESTAEIVEGWFGSEAAVEFGMEEWDAGKVKEGVVKGGGGWHGQGWLGKGRWSVGRSEMDESGVCKRCGERLVCIDIDPSETEEFAKSLAALACQREVKADFLGFKVCSHSHRSKLVLYTCLLKFQILSRGFIVM